MEEVSYLSFGTKSLEHLEEQILPATTLLKDLESETANSTVEEYDLEERKELAKPHSLPAAYRVVSLIKFCSSFCYGEDYLPAIQSVLNEIDYNLFFGNSDNNDLEIDGLPYLAAKNERLFGRKQVYTDPEEFYSRFNNEKGKYGHNLYRYAQGSMVKEGSTPGPSSDVVIALAPDAVRWLKLYGAFTIPLQSRSDQPKSIVSIYSSVKVLDPDGFFVLYTSHKEEITRDFNQKLGVISTKCA